MITSRDTVVSRAKFTRSARPSRVYLREIIITLTHEIDKLFRARILRKVQFMQVSWSAQLINDICSIGGKECQLTEQCGNFDRTLSYAALYLSRILVKRKGNWTAVLFFPREQQFILPIACASFTRYVWHRISSPVRIRDKTKGNREEKSHLLLRASVL
jgi:hypothetical protein